MLTVEERRERKRKDALARYHRNRDAIMIKRKARYVANRELFKQQSREWYRKNKERAKATRKKWEETHRLQRKITVLKYRFAHGEEIRERRRKKYRNTYLPLKAAIYDKLGRKCSRCGIEDMRVLCIDHVRGNGKQEREAIHCPYSYLKKIFMDSSGAYQILCQNCNWIKRWENKEIHGRMKRALERPERPSDGVYPASMGKARLIE